MTQASLSDFEMDSGHALVAAIASGRISAREACDAAIARIERLDATLNAVVVRDFDRAREQAAMRDRQRAQGDRLPLLGLPMTVKESFDVAGLPTTWGLPPFRDFRPKKDALAVERLKAAGAVILGKTNVAPSLADWQSTNPVYGRTVNPHDPSRGPGGSSGGSAAALASGMVALECGSDIGGSIRVPAAFCGVFGLKPSFGLVPSQGHVFPGTDGAEVDLAVVGPLALNVVDLEIALGVLAGAGSMDSVAWRADPPAPKVRGLADCRLLVLDTHPRARTDAVIRDALEGLCRNASRAGADIARESALLPDLGIAHDDYVAMLTAIVTRGAPDVEKVLSAHEWFDLLDKQIRLRRQWQALFERFDAVVAPTFGTVAYPHIDLPDMASTTLMIDGEATPYGAQLAWPGVATFANLPATSAPIGCTPDRLPIGVQVIGPFLQDRTTISIAGWLSALQAD
ncbi:amidase family protein [Rhizobacter sp. LjRoot28]|jgi:amidase|uniref:amidase family protein n=1 Tax=Rhizobacter sp. LjRoot28 TaxID=3342309 RepID=UPI003ECD0421